MAACSRDAIQKSFAAAEKLEQKSLEELEAELCTAKMLLLNTYPTEVCQQLMDMYGKLVVHTQGLADADDGDGGEDGPTEPPQVGQTDAATNTDADLPPLPESRPDTSGASTSHGLNRVANAAAAATKYANGDIPGAAKVPSRPRAKQVVFRERSAWSLGFDSQAAEEQFVRWWATRLVGRDALGLRIVLVVSLIVQLVLLMCCYRTYTHAQLQNLSWGAPCLCWLAVAACISGGTSTLIGTRTVWYMCHREPVLLGVRLLFAVTGVVHTLLFWRALEYPFLPMHLLFLISITVFPAYHFVIRWQVHAIGQLSVLLCLLVAVPLLLSHSAIFSDSHALVAIMLTVVLTVHVLPSVYQHTSERRARFLFVQRIARKNHAA